MGLWDGIRRLLGRADAALTDAEFAAMGAVHKAEDAVDDATGGHFYDTVEKLDEEANEVGEKLHLDDPRLDEPAGQ